MGDLVQIPVNTEAGVIQVFQFEENITEASTRDYDLSLAAFIAAVVVSPWVTNIAIADQTIGDADGQWLANLIVHTRSIEFLRIHLCSLTDGALSAIAGAVAQNTTIKTFSLTENGLEFMSSETLGILGDAIRANRSIERLSATDSMISEGVVRAFSNAIQNHPTLADVQFGGAQIKSAGVKLILDAVAQSTRIGRVTIFGSREIDAAGAGYIAAFIRQTRTVTHIDVSDNQLNDLAARVISQAFVNVDDRGNATEPVHITSLSLNGNPIKDIGAQFIATNIARSTGLTELLLEKVGVGHEGISAIASAAGNLRVLSINENEFGHEQIRVAGYNTENPVAGNIAEMLETNQNLRTLNMNNCGIGIGMLSRIIEGVTASSLTELDLHENPFGLEGANMLFDMLAMNPPLRVLDMRGIIISAEDYRYLTDVMAVNTNITDIALDETDLSGNIRNQTHAAMIDTTLRRNIRAQAGPLYQPTWMRSDPVPAA